MILSTAFPQTICVAGQKSKTFPYLLKPTILFLSFCRNQPVALDDI